MKLKVKKDNRKLEVIVSKLGDVFDLVKKLVDFNMKKNVKFWSEVCEFGEGNS